MTSKNKLHQQGQANSEFVFCASAQPEDVLPEITIPSTKRRSRAASVSSLDAAVNGESGKALVSGRSARDRSPEQKPSIVVIDERVLVRDCLVQCLQSSYRGHAVLAFSSLH